MPYKNREKQLEYFRKRNQREDVKAAKRAWVEKPESRDKRLARIKEYNALESTKEKQRSYREKTLAIRMGQLNQFPCFSCGETDPTVIDWHHVVPEDKLFELTGGIQRNHEVWWDEVMKCIPLCCNCHRKVHANKLCLIPLAQQIQWAKLQKKGPTESKPPPGTASTSVRTCTCQASQLFSQQLNLRSQRQDSNNGKPITPEHLKRQAPGVLPFT